MGLILHISTNWHIEITKLKYPIIKLTSPNVRVKNNFLCKTKLAKCVKSALKTYIGRRYYLELELQRLLYTVHIDRILSVKNAWAWVSMDFT